MSSRLVTWFPPCYEEATLLLAIQEALGVSAAIAGVARWLPDGRTSSQVAIALGKSVHTVKVQARQLEVALGVTTRTELAGHIVAAVWHRAWIRGELGAVRPTTHGVTPQALRGGDDADGAIDSLQIGP